MIKQRELVMIPGLSVSAIARRVQVDRKTVRNYLAKGLEPSTYKKRAPGGQRRGSLRTVFAGAPGDLSLLTAASVW